MSGDKLLGGPQAGVVLGSRHAIARLRQDPFARAMRVDKMTIAALTATLELYRDRETALREIPTLAMLTASATSIQARCIAVQSALQSAGISSEIVESLASAGGGAFPASDIPSFSVAMEGDAIAVEKKLRLGEIPVVGRISDGTVFLDLRSVPPSYDEQFTAAVVTSLE